MKFTLMLLLVMILNLIAAGDDSVAKGKTIYDSVCFLRKETNKKTLKILKMRASSVVLG
jgi:hypothetical protein